MKKLILLSGVLMPLLASAQNYAIDWHKIAGGGGTSSNGQYVLSGTIGQHDAGGLTTGGNYSITGGFWALYSVAQTPGAPPLYISQSSNTVTVYWQNVAGWNLQQKTNLATAGGWSASSGVTNFNGTNFLSLTPSGGNLFFRLMNP